ncbi:maleylacetoacetate isomerase [Burkholderia sp. FERM BP-3421]|uniref:maleylacetoacetate isomerase n=1 Tax=Burkholderia sp. FERM BP-3421 TaxID=1494466 RepID=UPI003082685A
MIKLHGFYRSSATFRVRIALNLKGVAYESVARDLERGAQREPAYLALNPQGLVPALEVDGVVLNQSLAIIAYLDERHPLPPLLPASAAERARVRALFQIVAADTHPITSMRVSAYLKAHGFQDAGVRAWQHHWLRRSFDALDALLSAERGTGRFSHGDQPTLADIALVPQVYFARRVGLELDAWPTIIRINEACLAEPAFAHAHPDRQ